MGKPYVHVEKVLTGQFYMTQVETKVDSDAEGTSQPLTVLHEAASFGMRVLQDAGRDQGGWSIADGRRPQLAVLLRKF